MRFLRSDIELKMQYGRPEDLERYPEIKQENLQLAGELTELQGTMFQYSSS
jgi:pantothenate synthetase